MLPINTDMKISEFIIVPKESKDTTSCGTTYSGQKAGSAQDIVPQNIVPENNMALEVDSEFESHPDHSAIAEGVSQIFRRKKGGGKTMKVSGKRIKGKRYGGPLPDYSK